MQLFRPDKKWPEPLPEAKSENKELKENSEKTIDPEVEKERIERWENDKKYYERIIADLKWELSNTRDKPKQENIKRFLKDSEEHLEWIKKWIKESEEKMEKLENIDN